MNFSYTVFIPLIPLFVFLFLGIFRSKLKAKVAGTIGILGLSTTTLLSFYTAYKYFFEVGKVGDVYQTIIAAKTTWINFTASAVGHRLRIHRGMRSGGRHPFLRQAL